MHLPSHVLQLSLSLPLALAFAGCTSSTTFAPSTVAPISVTGLAIHGRVHGGQQPITGAHVYLLAANTTGYGGPGIAPSTSNASVSLLSAASTGNSDSIGAYVLTDGRGNFSITGDYSCTPNTQVYLYALGGNPGLATGTNNTGAGLLAALGNCPAAGNFLTATPYVVINEVSTIATAYAFAGFASDATHVSSSGTALAQTGIANAFANAANLETLSTGVALAATPVTSGGNGIVPKATIDTLANILASCVNTTGPTGPANPTACDNLFGDALSGGSSGAAPSDAATAAINIAHNPAANVAALYELQTAQPPFAPTLNAQPNDFTVGLQFSGGGFIRGGAEGIAIDGSGDAWVTNSIPPDGDIPGGGSVVELSSSGSILSGTNGFANDILDYPGQLAIDGSSNVWVANYSANNIVKLSSSGSILSGTNGFTGGGLSAPKTIAIDGSGNAWVPNGTLPGSIVELSNSGSILSGTSGFALGGADDAPDAIAIDGSDNAWVAGHIYPGSSGIVIELSNSGSILSGANGFTGGGLNGPGAIAIDGSGSAWVIDYESQSGSITELSNSGSLLSGANGFNGGGLDVIYGIAIDGSGNAWAANAGSPSNINSSNGSLTELSSSGSFLSGANGFTGGGAVVAPVGIAIDGSGNVWALSASSEPTGVVIELIGAATPVITPICAGLPATPTSNGTSNLGTRP